MVNNIENTDYYLYKQNSDNTVTFLSNLLEIN